MKKPIVVINFKTYLTIEKALKLAKEIEKVDKDIIIGVSACDVYLINKKTKLQVFCQHIDPFYPGRNTGFILPESVKAAGAKGVFLNHSEHKLDFNILKESVKRAKEAKLKVLIFAKDTKEAKEVEKLKPDYIAVEPPELVAGEISVSSARPELISDVRKNLKSDFLVGAGIKTNMDFLKSLELGANGIAIASAITTAKNPGKVLKDLVRKK